MNNAKKEHTSVSQKWTHPIPRCNANDPDFGGNHGKAPSTIVCVR